MDAHIIFFSSTTHAAPRDSWLLHFYTDMEHQKLVKSKKVFFRACVFLFELAFVNRNYKTRKFLWLSCVYRYTFSFTLKLTTTLLQKLATLYIWSVKEKELWNESKHTPLLLWWIYDYESANLNIPITPYCFHRLVKTICYWIALRLVKLFWFEILESWLLVSLLLLSTMF